MDSVGNVPAKLKPGVGIVFADMDDTFLTTSKDLPAGNLELLDVLACEGVPFVPCTGRPVVGVPTDVMAHEATRYVVGSNGGVIYDVRARKNLRVRSIGPATVLDLYERVRGLGTTFDVFADGEVFAERPRYEAMRGYGLDAPSLEVLLRVRKPVDLTVPQIVERACSIEKITCFWHTEKDRDELASAIGEVDGLSRSSGHPRNFELQAKGVSKGEALVWLCDYLGIPLGESVAFGDADNDLPLLMAAGDGVAMGNATAPVLVAADHVTSSCNEAGVARYLLR